MGMRRKFLLISIAVAAAVQFIQPDRSVPAHNVSTDMLAGTNAPENIRQLVHTACYDCHSYETTYPFWSRITPVNFWIQDHVDEAREELNFSRWDLSAGSKEAGKCGEEVEEGEMPLPSYTWMHADARSSNADRAALVTWFNTTLGTSKGHGTRREENDEDGR